jgi:hypothetical protein
VNYYVNALAARPNGDVVAGGVFSGAGGLSASQVARWNGAGWFTLGLGVSGWVNALSLLPDGDLVMGGNFSLAGGSPSARVARYRFGSTCRADFNCSGTLEPQDLFDFMHAWFAADPRADFNGVGGITVQDILDFLAAWFVGCP